MEVPLFCTSSKPSNLRRTVITVWTLPRASECRTDVTVELVYQEIDLAGTVRPTIRTLSAVLY